MHLARFPRVRLFPTPTPLERLANLSRHLGGPEIWIKRDDCTVVATGGNKVRKLEWLVGEAQAQGADHLVTQGRGAVQPRAPDRRGGEAVRHEMHRAAGAPDRHQRPRLPEQRQRAARPAVRHGDRIPSRRDGHERRGGCEGRGAAGCRREALCDPGRRIQPGGRIGLRVLRPGTDAAGRRDGPADRPRGDRHRQRGHAGGPGGRAGGQQCRCPGARHRRAAPQGPAGSQRAPPGGSHRRLCRDAWRDSAFGGGGELRLCRARLRPADARHDRGGADAGAARGRAARSGVFRQGNGRTDRPDPQGRDRARARRVVFLHTGGAVGLFGYTGVFEQAMVRRAVWLGPDAGRQLLRFKGYACLGTMRTQRPNPSARRQQRCCAARTAS